MAKNNNAIKGNLVWLDLEMTGLDLERDVILEISSVITDGNLNVLEEGPFFVIHQPKEKLDAMNEWCKEHHGKSGLTQAVRESQISLQHAAEQTLLFIKKHCEPDTGLLAGNSVWQDRNFLLKYMPGIISYLNYRLIDVTTVKELVTRWYESDEHVEFEKKDTHRAREDIYESIAELKYYRKYFFV